MLVFAIEFVLYWCLCLCLLVFVLVLVFVFVYEDISDDKQLLCLIKNGFPGTGKSYLIYAIRNLLQEKCRVTTTIGMPSFNIREVMCII